MSVTPLAMTSDRRWQDIRYMSSDPRFSTAAQAIPDIIRKGRADNTNRQYDTYFKKFQRWCVTNSLCALPASVSTLAVFLSGLVQSNVSETVLNAYFYSIKWQHDCLLMKNPCEDKMLTMIMAGGRRILCKSVVKKEPITSDILKKIIAKYGQANSLDNVRLCTMLLIGFAGFLRFNEIAQLKLCHINIADQFMSLSIVRSKTDVYRRGSEVVIARTGEVTCPVMWVERYIKVARLTSGGDYVFRSIRYCKKFAEYRLCSINKPISYTRSREILLDALESVGLNKKKFGLHSLRSGGVSEASENNVSDRLLKAHGRWKTDIAKDGYIKDSQSKKMLVSLNLNI